jgi:hypothetical protein
MGNTRLSKMCSVQNMLVMEVKVSYQSFHFHSTNAWKDMTTLQHLKPCAAAPEYSAKI